MIGLHPAEMYELELWELNACIRAYNKKQEAANRSEFARVWQTANLTGAAFGGKLKKLAHYLSDEPSSGVRLTEEEMADFDRRLAEKERGEASARRAEG